jgi:xylulokinase
MVLLDRDGNVLRPALLWNDTRSAGAAAALTEEVGAEDYAKRTGLVPVASFTVTKVRWVRDHEPDVAGRVAAVALPHDWLTWRLRGYGPVGASPLGPDLGQLTTDRSDASGTGYWNPATGAYDLELFRLAFGRAAVEAGGGSFGDAVILPRVLAPGTSPGEVHPAVAREAMPPGQSVLPVLPIKLGAGAGITPQRHWAWAPGRVTSSYPWAPAGRCSPSPMSPSATRAGRWRVSPTRAAFSCRLP